MTAKIVAFDVPLLSGPGEPPRSNHEEVKVTNGVSALTVEISKSVGKNTQVLMINPSAAAAIELAVALLNGAYHVQHGIHAGEFQSPSAFEHVGTARDVLRAYERGEVTPKRD